MSRSYTKSGANSVRSDLPSGRETPLSKLMEKDIMRGSRPAYLDAKGPPLNDTDVTSVAKKGLKPTVPVNPNFAYNLGEGKYSPLEVSLSNEKGSKSIKVRLGNQTRSYAVGNDSKDGWRGIIETIRKDFEGSYDKVVFKSSPQAELAKYEAQKPGLRVSYDKSGSAVYNPDFKEGQIVKFKNDDNIYKVRLVSKDGGKSGVWVTDVWSGNESRGYADQIESVLIKKRQ